MTEPLFPELGKGGKLPPKPKPKGVEGHLWTAEKSLLIAEYVHRFLMVTKNGIYIDLFAGPQGEVFNEDWSVKRVVELRTEGNPAINHYALCDKSRKQVALLRQLKAEHQERSHTFEVYPGDANKQIGKMLDESSIKPKSACFCLMDQRTLECEWSTVEQVAKYKDGYKIEIFYFLAQGWIDRAMKSTRNFGRLERWWGRKDYNTFLDLHSVDRAWAFCNRFQELGYAHVHPFAIYEKGDHGRTMYYMIHASDHPKAQSLMAQAYNQVRKNSGEGAKQRLLFTR